MPGGHDRCVLLKRARLQLIATLQLLTGRCTVSNTQSTE
jgi:hypothetical protein